MPGGSGYKTALRDPCVELDASGKKLGKKDEGGLEGFPEFATALISTLRSGDGQQRVVVLEELCLRGNQLGNDSFEPLAEIVKLAAGDLKDLDLSENDFVIESELDVLAWERFLSSFSGCFVLRRWDLSGNPLGTKGFEILAKMYGREAPLELLLDKGFTKDEDAVESTSEDGLMMMESTKTTALRTRRASNAREFATESTPYKTPTKAAFQSSKVFRQGKLWSIYCDTDNSTYSHFSLGVSSEREHFAVKDRPSWQRRPC